MSLLVLCPSKGRPDKAKELLASFAATYTSNDSRLLFVLDEGEEGDYPENWMAVPSSGRRGMTDPLNAAFLVNQDDFDIIGFVGDDHRFRTRGWDTHFETVLAERGPGLIYGNDKNWVNGEIPTQIFGSVVIWKALGWMALPTAQHLYLDNTWRILGDAIERLFYMPDVIIEHEHPAYGKTEWDEGYIAVNNAEMYAHDQAAFEAWLKNDAERDIERVRQSALG